MMPAPVCGGGDSGGDGSGGSVVVMDDVTERKVQGCDFGDCISKR